MNAGSAFAKPLYPLSTTPPSPLVRGTTLQIAWDWSRANALVAGKPDRSFNSIWVRVFPLVSVPLGDPYPDTQNYKSALVTNANGVKVYTLANQVLVGSGKTLSFDFGAGVLKIDNRAVPLEPFWLEPVSSGGYTELNWDKGMKLPSGKAAEVRTRMRGGFVVKKSVHQPKDKPIQLELWSIINVVSVNEYIQSVVPSEVIASWAKETLRAQAIAARTYGMYEVATARLSGQDFDVDPSTWFQSYQGMSFWNRDAGTWYTVELPATSDAVKTTSGQVITHKGEVIKAYFSSNSGGRTCTVTECLEQAFNPDYIQEVDDHPQIKASPGGTWGTKATLTSDNITNVLKPWGVNLGSPVKRLESLEKGISGRTWRLRVVLQDGSHVDLDRLLTRKIMHLYGPIRSFMYDLGAVGSDGKQVIKGFGYGHAVGMSQWGAQLYAKGGWSATRILEHYYANVSVVDLSGN